MNVSASDGCIVLRTVQEEFQPNAYEYDLYNNNISI